MYHHGQTLTLVRHLLSTQGEDELEQVEAELAADLGRNGRPKDGQGPLLGGLDASKTRKATRRMESLLTLFFSPVSINAAEGFGAGSFPLSFNSCIYREAQQSSDAPALTLCHHFQKSRIAAHDSSTRLWHVQVFLKALSLTFLAEWGDRSQIATIG